MGVVDAWPVVSRVVFCGTVGMAKNGRRKVCLIKWALSMSVLVALDVAASFVF